MTAAEIKDLVTFLAAQGVRSFEGEGLRIEFGATPTASPVPPARRVDPEFPSVDPDLFAHEAA